MRPRHRQWAAWVAALALVATALPAGVSPAASRASAPAASPSGPAAVAKAVVPTTPVPGVRFVGRGDWVSATGPANGSKWNSEQSALTPARASSLRQAWGRLELGGRFRVSASAGGLALTTVESGSLVAVDVRSGRVVWTGPSGALMIAVSGSTVYIAGNIDGAPGGIAALDLTTGRLRWKRTFGVGMSPYGWGFTAAQGRLLIGMNDGTLRAFRQSDGAALWVSRVRVIGAIVVDRDRVVAMAAVDGAGPDELSPVAFDLRTGRVLWKGLGGGDYRGLVARGGHIWATTSAGIGLTRWTVAPCRPDERLCRQDWTTPTGLTRGQFGGADDSTYFMVGARVVQAHDLATGAVKWTAPSHTLMRTAIAGDLLVGVWATGTLDGMDVGFQAVDARGCGSATCPVLHEQRITGVSFGGYMSDPMVTNDGLVLDFGSDGGLVAYSLPDQPAPPAPAAPKSLGWYPSGGTAFSFGAPGDRPLAGDFDGDGADNVGVRRSNVFLLRTTPGPGRTQANIVWGQPTDVPLIGDWDGDGTDTVGLWRAGTFYLKASNRPALDDITAIRFGDPTDTPLVGDWNGDGITDIGVKRGNRYFLRGFGNVTYGGPADTPLVGDWNGDGTDTIAVKRGNRYFLSGNNKVAQYAFTTGEANDVPLAADLLGDSTDELTLTRR